MRIRIVDAFTDRPFSGNPAGVLLLDSFPDDDWLRNVAKEVNHAETAFAHPLPPGGEADWALRWFTPVAEVAIPGLGFMPNARFSEADEVRLAYVAMTRMTEHLLLTYDRESRRSCGGSSRRGLRVPAHDGHDSEPMADTIPMAWRTVFRWHGGHFGGRIGMLSAMISERCPPSPARGR